MRLRAKVSFNRSLGAWVVTLWSHSLAGVPYFFGQKIFEKWYPALRWAIWRVHRA